MAVFAAFIALPRARGRQPAARHARSQRGRVRAAAFAWRFARRAARGSRRRWMTLAASARSLHAPEFASFAAGARTAAATSGAAGGHRAAACAAPEAARGLRTQDAGAHGVGPAARRGGGVDSAIVLLLLAASRHRHCRLPLAALLLSVPRSLRLLAAVARGARGNLNERRATVRARAAACPVLFGLSVFGLRGLLDIRDALATARSSPAGVARALAGHARLVGRGRGVPVLFAGVGAGRGALAGGGGGRRPWVLGGAAVSRVRRGSAWSTNCSMTCRCISISSRSPWKRAVVCPRRSPACARSCARRRAAPRLGARHPRDSRAAPNRSRRCARLEQRLGLKPLAALVTALRSAEQVRHRLPRRCCANGRGSRRRSGLRGPSTWRAPRRSTLGGAGAVPSRRARSSCWRFRCARLLAMVVD